MTNVTEGVLFPEPEHDSPAHLVTAMVEWLQTSLDPHAARARAVINAWYAAWGDDPGLRGALLSREDGQHVGALFELYLWALFVDHGYNVEPHPTVPGTTRRPDFLVTKGSTSFYVEATTVGIAPATRAEQRRLNRVLDGFRAASHPAFMVAVSTHTTGPGSPRVRPLVEKVLGWLDTLDPDLVRQTPIRNRPSMLWEEAGWKLEFDTIPVSEPADDGILGMWHPALGTFLTDDVDLKACLERKSKRYGDLDAPYVIAVLERTQFGGDEHRVDALYGSPAVTISLESDETHGFRRGNGFWRSTTAYKNRHVSAVLLCSSLRAWMRPLPLPSLWLHPTADHPFEPSWLPLQTWRVVDGLPNVEDGPTEWPMPR
jgi:hypothetical protein